MHAKVDDALSLRDLTVLQFKLPSVSVVVHLAFICSTFLLVEGVRESSLFFFGLDQLPGCLLLLRIGAELDLAVRMIPLLAAIAHHPGHAIDVAVICVAEVDLRAPVAALVLLVARMAVLAEAHYFVAPCHLQLDLRELGLLLSQERGLVLLSQLERSRVLVLARLLQLALLVEPLTLVVRAPVLVEAVFELVFAICEITREHRVRMIDV